MARSFFDKVLSFFNTSGVTLEEGRANETIVSAMAEAEAGDDAGVVVADYKPSLYETFIGRACLEEVMSEGGGFPPTAEITKHAERVHRAYVGCRQEPEAPWSMTAAWSPDADEALGVALVAVRNGREVNKNKIESIKKRSKKKSLARQAAAIEAADTLMGASAAGVERDIDTAARAAGVVRAERARRAARRAVRGKGPDIGDVAADLAAALQGVDAAALAAAVIAGAGGGKGVN